MDPQVLLDLINQHDIRPSEFESKLSAHFSRAMHVAPNTIAYPDDSSNFALRVTYTDDDTIQSIEGGPALKSTDIDALVERIEKDIIASAGTKIGAVVLFGTVPVNGCHRYGDLFQILPVPPDAPRPPYVLGHHPFLLEFSFTASSDSLISMFRRSEIGRDLELFLCGTVNNAIHSMGSSGKSSWVMSSDSVNPIDVAYRQEMYSFPGMSPEREAFSPIDDIAKASLETPTEFYARRGISHDDVLALPNTFDTLFRIFHHLEAAERHRFLRSCFWFQQANRVHRYSRSAYFTALISAIEALMPPPSGGTKCPTCKQFIGKGPTARFVEFVDQFAPGPGDMSRDRRRLYHIRSAMSHGGALLRSDLRTGWGLTPGTAKEWEDLGNAWTIIRVALVNWLMSHI